MRLSRVLSSVKCHRSTWLAGLVALALVGCEDTVAPTGDAGRPFTLYAVLDPTADRQALRVATFRESIEDSEGEAIDAVVTSTDLNTGETVSWADSLIDFGGGRVGHVFQADFRPVHGHTYRIEANRSDGAVSSAEVTIPPLVEPLPLLAEVGGTVVLNSLWPGAPELNEPTVTYVVQDAACVTRFVTIPTSRPAEPFEFGWRVQTDLLEDANRVFAEVGLVNLGLIEVRLNAVVSDPGWYPPGGVFDPEVLIDPNAFTNVRNGFGFVGSGYTVPLEIPITSDLWLRAGFGAPNPGC